MSTLPEACDTCNIAVKDVFDKDTGTRKVEIITGDLLISDCCFVRDEIRFINNGRLIFTPQGGEKEGEYCKQYFVICRKLVVVGGHKPGTLNPCGPDDPGQMYRTNNVITWLDRLNSAATGTTPSPPQATDGENFGRNNWLDQGQGNNGKNGGTGDNGVKGNKGQDALSAPLFTLIALEVEIGIGDHLTIDFDGQNGGEGGVGQKGGNGGDGMGGNMGKSDTSWPGTGCDRQPGHGGDGGNGGDGGDGGNGGNGGNASDITIISTSDNISASGPFLSGHITYVNDGGSGGLGGLGGFGGRGGRGGIQGFKTSECDSATMGNDGDDGLPPVGFGAGSSSNQGSTGVHGMAASLAYFQLEKDTCAEMIPLPITITTDLDPANYCRGFSAPATEDGKLTGLNLAQITSAEVTGLANITTTIKASSTDTQLDLKFDIADNSDLGAGNLELDPDFGSSVTINNALQVNRFEVLSITPATGARGNDVTVTITGECFNPSALLQQVVVSGLGVNALNILILDEQTLQCVFSIGALATLGARDVTVKVGVYQHTLLNSFTVTQ